MPSMAPMMDAFIFPSFPLMYLPADVVLTAAPSSAQRAVLTSMILIRVADSIICLANSKYYNK